MGDAGIEGNLYTGLADFEETSFLIHNFNNDDLFIDIDANIWDYTLLASGICKSTLFSIEPIPSTFKKLEKNIELNGLNDLVHLFNLGIGGHESIQKFTK